MGSEMCIRDSSSIERIPVERAIINVIRDFKQIAVEKQEEPV